MLTGKWSSGAARHNVRGTLNCGRPSRYPPDHGPVPEDVIIVSSKGRALARLAGGDYDCSSLVVRATAPAVDAAMWRP